MIKRRWELSRRHLLRGAGASLALPLLDVMGPSVQRATAQGEAPARRWVMWHFPSGYNQTHWAPTGPGDGEKDWELTPSLEPLGEFGVKEDVTVIQGLSAPYSNGPGASHTCGVSGQLSGFLCPRDITENRRTIDQGIADAIGSGTKIPSLQLGTAILHENPNDEPGYSANIKDHLSWRDDTTPLPKQIEPRQVFERLFGDVVDTSDDTAAMLRRERLKSSILDTVLSEAAELQPRLSAADRDKLEQYLQNVREVEQSIHVEPRNNASGMCDAQGRVASFGTPDDIQQHVRQMNQLMALALQCDVTRVIVFQYETTVTTIRHPFIDVPAPYHLGVAHHGSELSKLEYYFRVNRWLVSQYAEFLTLLKNSPDGNDSTLLDNSAVIMTSELADGDLHNHVNLPCLLAGRAGGSLEPGRFLNTNDQFMRLLVASAQAVGADIDGWGTDYQRSGYPQISGALDRVLVS